VLLPSPASARRDELTAPTPPAIVVVARPGAREVWESAVAQAAHHRVVLHVILTQPRPSPLRLLLGLRRTTDSTVPAHVERAADLGIHVEVHRTTGCPHALAAGIAETLGAPLVAQLRGVTR
jgi:hypothetical protein